MARWLSRSLINWEATGSIPALTKCSQAFSPRAFGDQKKLIPTIICAILRFKVNTKIFVAGASKNNCIERLNRKRLSPIGIKHILSVIITRDCSTYSGLMPLQDSPVTNQLVLMLPIPRRQGHEHNTFRMKIGLPLYLILHSPWRSPEGFSRTVL